MDATTEIPTYRIPTDLLPNLQKKIDRLSRKGEKLGTGSVSLVVLATELEKDGEFATVTVKGATPEISGWHFVATLAHEEDGTILRVMPFLDHEYDLTQYRHATPDNCDHCHMVRRRNDTLVIADDDGNMMQVGRSCVKDFIPGANDPLKKAEWLEAMADYLDELEAGQRGESTVAVIDIREFLADVNAVVRTGRGGYISKSKADYGENSTSAQSLYNYQDRKVNKRDEEGYITYTPTEDIDYVESGKMIDWLLSVTEDVASKNDFMWSLYVATRRPFFRARNAGIVAATYVAYHRAMNDLKMAAAAKDSEFQGSVGSKIAFTATVNFVRSMGCYSYGSAESFLYKMTDEDGNRYVWFSTKNFTQGDTLSIEATVKSHDVDTYEKGNPKVTKIGGRAKVTVL